MKWNNLGLALGLLVLLSAHLVASDGAKPHALSPARVWTEANDLPAVFISPHPRVVTRPPPRYEAQRPSKGRSESFSYSLGSPSWWLSRRTDPPSVHLTGGVPVTSAGQGFTPRDEWFAKRVDEDSVLSHHERIGPGGCAPTSYSELAVETDNELPPVFVDGTSDTSYNFARFTQPAEIDELPAPFDPPEPLEPIDEWDQPDFQLITESDEPPADDPVAYYMPFYRPILAARLGGWFVDATGSPTKVGEYQGLDSSPFWDLDGLFSNGLRTVDFFATGLDNDSTQAGLDYFGPWLAADFDLQRYLHRLDHDPLTNMGDMQSGEEAIREDLNVGEDYAIRVEDVKTSFRGQVTEHIKARLNFRYLRRHGERQASAMQHCFCELQQGNCHVLSQRQRIDWRTAKIEPVIEAKYGSVRAEYSRPMRMFDQGDQVVTRTFGLHFRTEQPYAFVPENFTQVDRLKVSVDLTPQTHVYARLSAGDTRNKFRETHRKFQVYDLRLTNRTWDGLTLTGYLNLDKQTNQPPPFLLPEEQEALSWPNAWVPPYGLRRPIDYSRAAAGVEANWRPFSWSNYARGFSLTGGFERGSVDREFADYFIEDPQAVVDQEHTLVTSGHVGASMRFSPQVDTFVRYKYRGVEDPLFGVNRYEGATNTNLPEHEHLVELGGTWIPVDNLIANVTFGMENRRHESEIAYFDEYNHPLTITLWYAPTPAWSLSAGYGYYSNWIDQDMLYPGDDPQVATWDRRRWNYGGRSRILNVGAAYLWTPTITLSGGLEIVSARDAIDPLTPWPDLASYSRVIVDRTRVTAGVDWQLRERISAYLRYRFEEYVDRSADYNSGRAHMSLGGFSAVY